VKDIKASFENFYFLMPGLIETVYELNHADNGNLDFSMAIKIENEDFLWDRICLTDINKSCK
jgi:hypothetical protein